MAIDQVSVPKDPLPSNPNRYLFTACSSACSTVGGSSAGDESADDYQYARKVKLLCSFGGKILPRPSDRALRYAGGETRIIAVRRDTTLPELCRKMADVYGAPVAIRYQLPDEDLDALVSISSAEDLENMMDEYDKLAEVSGDGSAKLRVFLFTQAEIASVLADNFSARTSMIDPYDGGQKYVEAVNGGSALDAGIYGCEIRPKGSVASASSTQNLDAGFDGSYNEGASPAIVSPIAASAASFDPSRLAFGGITSPVPLPDDHGFPAYSTNFGQATVATQSLNPPLAAPYASQAFVEPHKVHYMPHSLHVPVDPRMVNVVSVPQHTYLPCMPIPCSSMHAQLESVKTVQGNVDFFSDDDPLSGRFVLPVSDPGYKAFQQPLPQIPPLQPSHLPPPSMEPYGLHVVPPLTQEPMLRFEDCHLCQKALPHVHSDRLVNELGSVSGVHVSNDHPIVHSYHSEDITRLQRQHRVVSVSMMDSFVEPKVDHNANPCQYGTYGASKVAVLERDQLFGTTAEKIEHSKLRQPYDTLGLSGDAQASYGVFVNSPQSHLDGFFQHEQKQILHGDNFHAATVLHPTDTFPLSSSVHASNGASLSPPHTLHDDSLHQQNVLLDESADCIPVLHPSGEIGLSSTGPTSYGVFLRPPETHHDESLQHQQLPAGEATHHDNSLEAHHGGSKLSLSNAFISTGLLPKENPMDPVNPLLSTMMELHTSELPITCQASTMTGSCVLQTQNFERGAKPLLSSQRFPGISSYITDPVYTNAVAEGTRVWKDKASEVQNLFDDMAASQICNDPFPMSTLIASGEAGQLQGTFAPVSLLGNEDPQKILGITNAYLPSPAIVAARDTTIYGEISSENRLPRGPSPDITVLLEEGALQPPVDWLIRESNADPVVDAKDSRADNINQDLRDLAVQVGEAVLQSSQPVSLPPFSRPKEMSPSPDIAVLLEEGAPQPPVDWLIKASHLDPIVDTKDTGTYYINQDLHDLAEQVVESVLQSSKEMSPPFLRGSGFSEGNSNSQSAVLCDQRVEDIKARQSDKLHMGLLMANDIGHLQIIKNSDLEELRELGSGTFGTVYHGKWRGSDVAIKRINDRCFAGKPSEQEKMRADFWNEASKLADLHHPNVVAFYGVVIDGPGGSFATVTEYMVNGSLRNALQRNDKAFDRRKCLLIAMDVAFGMEYLHGKNIVHFDLKSDNLLVNLRDPQRPICKVGDLGLSKVKCKTLISGGVRGTLPWMAPELLNGSSNLVSEKVDVFSFGIVMWELLTGEEPYSDLHYGAIIGGIVSNTLRPAIPDSCDPEWGALMERCWSTEPTKRPCFTEVANRLRAMEASLPQKGQVLK